MNFIYLFFLLNMNSRVFMTRTFRLFKAYIIHKKKFINYKLIIHDFV
jgi:hypothetical protein